MKNRTKVKTKNEYIATPILDRVLIEQDKADEKSTGGIFIPETAQEKPQRGRVVAVGKGRSSTEPMEVKIGDIVLYGAYAGQEITIKGKEYLIMKESDILVII